MLRKRPGVHLDGVGLGSGRQGRGVGAQAAPEKKQKTILTEQERRPESNLARETEAARRDIILSLKASHHL